MMNRPFCVFVGILAFVTLPITTESVAAAPNSLPSAATTIDVSIEMVPMRDGVKLKTLIYRPASVSGRNPVVLMRTPYNQDQQSYRDQATRFTKAGYVAITQDCRGRFGSEGQFVFYWGEGPDGFDTVEWIRKQTWSNGRVGMWGPSYMGSTQWLTAAEGTPLAALAPTASASNFYYNLHVGGTYMLPMAKAGFSMDLFGPATDIGGSPKWTEWFQHLPLTDWGKHLGRRLPWQETMIEHYLPDGFWNRADAYPAISGMDFPGQHIVGYFDFMCRDAVRSYQAMCKVGATEEARRNQQLIIGPWDHGTGNRKLAEVDFGPSAQLDWIAENISWFDRFLKHPESPGAFPRVRYFSMGENRWRVADAWPPSEARDTPFFLHSSGHANTRHGDGKLSLAAPAGDEPGDTYKSDPADPVPAWPAHGKEYREVWGPVDQQLNLDRDDVLVYLSDALKEPVTFAGQPRAELHVAANTVDADWVVKLVDVSPEGVALPLATGVMRGSARNSELRREPLVPNETYRIIVDLGHSAARIDSGHRLGVQIAGSHFPMYDRNLHTGEGPEGTKMLVATQNVFHSAAKPSRLMLPLMSGDR